jgi:hypothetical protein
MFTELVRGMRCTSQQCEHSAARGDRCRICVSRKWTVDEQLSILRTLQLTAHLNMELPR